MNRQRIGGYDTYRYTWKKHPVMVYTFTEMILLQKVQQDYEKRYKKRNS